ncbi:MAG TPA: hypothetical protein VK034_31490, partial [Enhygromyxa sp.]|nr:hypothetical protein [Enhygromyxa sp.]
GDHQAKLVGSIDTLVAALDAGGADYRIGVTTSDNGNLWCPAGNTTPESGKLVLSSCKSRLGDFLFGNDVDVQDLACNDLCSLDGAALEITPTATQVDPNPIPRPWVERIGGATNLPAGTDVADALRCFLPQGVNGCGFESQLESMYLSVVRAMTPTEAHYGFIRPDSVLAVILVTDEADCSANDDSIFQADGNQVFWSDPMAAYPTSAVCWNAGVVCVGDPSAYDSCDPVNKDVNGNSNVSDEQAVLHPVSRYTGLLADLEADLQQLQPGREIVVGYIGGVPSNGVPFYADVSLTDPAYQDSFGIGPGCSAPNPLDPNWPITAVPPVRARDVTEAFGEGTLYSICESSYGSALADIAGRIVTQLP